jgi:hypothetical protein
MVLIQKAMSRVGIQMQVCVGVDHLPPQRDAVLGGYEQIVPSRCLSVLFFLFCCHTFAGGTGDGGTRTTYDPFATNTGILMRCNLS